MILDRPIDEIVTDREIKDRITNGDDADQFAVAVVPDQISKTTAKTAGYRNGPGQRCETK